jgi:hypothetical protein
VKAPLCSLYGCGAQFGAWPVHNDGHRRSECGGENSGTRCISILIYGVFCVLGDVRKEVVYRLGFRTGLLLSNDAHISMLYSQGATFERRWASNHSVMYGVDITDMLERWPGITPTA